MTIRGDMVATLVSKGKTWDEAKKLVTSVLDCANGPDFAVRYAHETGTEVAMEEYYRVIQFLKWSI